MRSNPVTVGTRIGIDVVDTADVREALASFGGAYLARIAGPDERRWCVRLDALDERRVAALFAGKEAVAKALAPEPDDPLPLRSIVLSPGSGIVGVALEGAASALAKRRKVTAVSVSLGIARESATAFALAHMDSPTLEHR